MSLAVRDRVRGLLGRSQAPASTRRQIINDALDSMSAGASRDDAMGEAFNKLIGHAIAIGDGVLEQ